MSLHPAPKVHRHRCFQGCSRYYDCSRAECRRLKWYGVCPKCYLDAKNFFNTARAYMHPKINDPAEREVIKANKRLFNPKPLRPTPHSMEDQND